MCDVNDGGLATRTQNKHWQMYFFSVFFFFFFSFVTSNLHTAKMHILIQTSRGAQLWWILTDSKGVCGDETQLKTEFPRL